MQLKKESRSTKYSKTKKEKGGLLGNKEENWEQNAQWRSGNYDLREIKHVEKLKRKQREVEEKG